MYSTVRLMIEGQIRSDKTQATRRERPESRQGKKTPPSLLRSTVPNEKDIPLLSVLKISQRGADKNNNGWHRQQA